MAEDGALTTHLVVMDTGPLITLAAAESLDYLLYPALPVLIADAVFHEATVKEGALGAQDIVAWVQAHAERVRILPTQGFRNFLKLREADPDVRARDLGELAALEIVNHAVRLEAGERAVLLTEDAGAVRAARLLDREGRLITVTTRDFLEALEQAGRINSAQSVYDRAEDGDRRASRLQALRDEDQRGREALRRVLAASEPEDAG